ncbi:helix-turn-helix transcriptional regulator [Rathayibacter sp. VKM Ac-2754]|uniref:helix-turn-helix transcriptional regulator n=1 Tax=Rathayibacter sp. VKM Ac-2754 TaxID=2609251 RepID=UPI00135B8792|nr:helix-turn-helix transcriptional regulator [Rathayibacter sp. VKM Ac-2754]MWV59286.1 hypothetical protein [Rathayibacter sp. VKM Ac-2754]
MEPVDLLAKDRLRAAASAEQWDTVVEILGRSWVELLQDAPRELLAVLETLPDPILDGHPRLRFGREYVLRMLGGPDLSAGYRLVLTEATRGDAIDRLALLTARIAAARFAGAGADVVRLVTAAHELRRRQPLESDSPLAGALAEFHYQWGLALEHAGELDAAVLDYVESWDWAASVGHRMMQRASAGAIAYLHALHGRIASAQTWLDKRPPERPGDWWEPDFSVKARFATSLVRTAQLLPSTADFFDGVGSFARSLHWAAYFFTSATAIRDPHAARMLRNELDTFVADLPQAQRTDSVNVAYIRISRLLFSARAEELGRPDTTDRPTASAHFLRQFPAAVHAARLARAGRSRAALQLAAPLLGVDRSRPRVLVTSLIATAIATSDAAQRSELLSEAVGIAHAHRYYYPFAFLPAELRSEVAVLFDELGAADVSERLTIVSEGFERATGTALSRRERAVAEHAAAGESTSEIAAALGVSVNTVKTQLRTVYRKLGVSSRTELRHLHRPR